MVALPCGPRARRDAPDRRPCVRASGQGSARGDGLFSLCRQCRYRPGSLCEEPGQGVQDPQHHQADHGLSSDAAPGRRAVGPSDHHPGRSRAGLDGGASQRRRLELAGPALRHAARLRQRRRCGHRRLHRAQDARGREEARELDQAFRRRICGPPPWRSGRSTANLPILMVSRRQTSRLRGMSALSEAPSFATRGCCRFGNAPTEL